MRLYTAALSLMASTAAALSDSSPLVLFSTTKLVLPSEKTPQLQSASRALRNAHHILSNCPTTRYLLINQPNVHASDLRDPHSGTCHSANLCSAFDGEGVNGRYDVAEVLGGDIHLDGLSTYIKATCTEHGRMDGLRVEEHELDILPLQRGEERAARLAQNDVVIGDILAGVQASGDDYTVIYLSSPHTAPLYESEYVESPAIRMELKRRTGDFVEHRADKAANSSAPLFVKYQFFTPGIFMGIVATLLMLAILYVGLSAVSSLEVSYGAFDKENGPAAQKKNM